MSDPPAHSDDTARDVRQAALSLHPYALAAYSVLMLYAQNLDEVSLRHVAVPLLASLVFAALTVVLARRAFGTGQRALIAASYVVLISFAYGHVYGLVQDALVDQVVHLRFRFALLACALVTVGGLLLLRRARFDEDRASAVVGKFALALLALSVVWIAFGWVASGVVDDSFDGDAVEESGLVVAAPARPRDVYYLVFDRYASNETLERHYGYDHCCPR